MRIRGGLWLGLPVGLCAILVGCAGTPALEPSQLTPLQVRAIETRSYETPDAKAMLKVVLNVLQDEGFLVDYGNSELGLLHASRTVSGGTTSQIYTPAIARFSLSGNGFFGSLTTIEATVNVSPLANQTKVRINFQQRVNSSAGPLNGSVFTAIPVTDPRIYQEFFAKLDRGLFIQKQGL